MHDIDPGRPNKSQYQYALRTVSRGRWTACEHAGHHLQLLELVQVLLGKKVWPGGQRLSGLNNSRAEAADDPEQLPRSHLTVYFFHTRLQRRVGRPATRMSNTDVSFSSRAERVQDRYVKKMVDRGFNRSQRIAQCPHGRCTPYLEWSVFSPSFLYYGTIRYQ